MLHILKFLPLLVNIDSETLLNWSNIDNLTNSQMVNPLINLRISNFESSASISLDNIRLIVEDLWEKIKNGLSLNDIENVLFFILFIRFVILSLRYNLKTSFYITCIGLFAGYLWYRHLIDFISIYRSLLLQVPFLHKLGMDVVQSGSINQEMLATDFKWYNIGQILYYAFKNGIINMDTETKLRYYIDPISMFVSNLQEPIKSSIFSIYYKIYNNIIPKIFDICSKFWAQLSGVAVYAIITRIGKRYCPYLIRWHWTFLLIIGMIEQIFVYFIHRAYYFQTFILIPQTKVYSDTIDSSLNLQLIILNVMLAGFILTHVGFIIFGLFHAIWGQYFYIPFFVENTELHIGKRPTNSLYSGGQTAWQESKEKNVNTLFPKIWYGWFGRGTKNTLQINNRFKKLLQKFFKKLKKQFRN